MSRVEDIIEYAIQLRDYLHTNNPYRIAEYFGFEVKGRVESKNSRPAYVIKAEGYPVVISIMDGYTERAKKILCAHELGHALLHDGYNSYDVSAKNKDTNVEYEANIFAMALLSDDLALCQIKNRSPFEIKSILDKRIVKASLEE